MNNAQKRRKRKRIETQRLDKKRKKLKSILDFDNIFSARTLFDKSILCEEDVRWKTSVQRFMDNRLDQCLKLEKEIQAGTYKPRETRMFYLHERGKTREIRPVEFRDRAVQRSICDNILLPLLEPTLIHNNMASRKGFGTSAAQECFRKHLKEHYRKYKTEGYILLFDFKSYFASIPTDRAMQGLSELIYEIAETEEEKYNAKRIIDILSYFCCGDEGVTLGNQTSQTIAIWYTSCIDHYFTEVLQVPYARYMDDGYALFPDKKSAEEGLKIFKEKAKELRLTPNTKKTYIAPLFKKRIMWLKGIYTLKENGAVDIRMASCALRHWKRHARKTAKKMYSWQISDSALEMTLQSRNSIVLKCSSRNKRRIKKHLDEFADNLLMVS